MSTSRCWIPPPPEPVPGDAASESSESLSVASTESTATLVRTGTTHGGPRVRTGADDEKGADGDKGAEKIKIEHSDLMALHRVPSLAVLAAVGVDENGDNDGDAVHVVGNDGNDDDAAVGCGDGGEAVAARVGGDRGGVADGAVYGDCGGVGQGFEDHGRGVGEEVVADDQPINIYDAPHDESQSEAEAEEKAETVERVEVGGGDVCFYAKHIFR